MILKSNDDKLYYKGLIDRLEKNSQSFQEQCQKDKLEVITLLDKKYQVAQGTLNAVEIDLMEKKTVQNNLMISISQKQSKCSSIKMWNQVKKKAVQIQQNQIKEMKELNELLKDSLTKIELQSKQMQQKVNQKQIRRNKLAQFSQSFNIDKKSNNGSVPKRIFSPFGYDKKALQPKVQYKPQQRQLIFRAQSFQGKIVEFVLFFDETQRKYGLKNPLKLFKSADIMAVKNFNIHQDRRKLWQEFQDIVVVYMDNAPQ